jgi:hypothetical protein
VLYDTPSVVSGGVVYPNRYDIIIYSVLQYNNIIILSAGRRACIRLELSNNSRPGRVLSNL